MGNSNYSLNIAKYDGKKDEELPGYGTILRLNCSKNGEKAIILKLISENSAVIPAIKANLNQKNCFLSLFAFAIEQNENFCFSKNTFFLLVENFDYNIASLKEKKKEFSQAEILQCAFDISQSLAQLSSEEYPECEIDAKNVFWADGHFKLLHPTLSNHFSKRKKGKSKGPLPSLAYLLLTMAVNDEEHLDGLFKKCHGRIQPELVKMIEWLLNSPTLQEFLFEITNFHQTSVARAIPQENLIMHTLKEIPKESSVMFPHNNLSTLRETDSRSNYYSEKPTLHFENGGKYEGSLRNGVMHGKGRLFDEKGRIVYEGNFRNGNFHGNGIMYNHEYQNKPVNPKNLGDALIFCWTRYEGEFSNDKKEGFGVMNFANGDVFIGGFSRDLACGQGSYTVSKGKKNYSGVWRNNKKIN